MNDSHALLSVLGELRNDDDGDNIKKRYTWDAPLHELMQIGSTGETE